VKAYRGEPANEKADIQADKAISGKDVPRIQGPEGSSVVDLSPWLSGEERWT